MQKKFNRKLFRGECSELTRGTKMQEQSEKQTEYSSLFSMMSDYPEEPRYLTITYKYNAHNTPRLYSTYVIKK